MTSVEKLTDDVIQIITAEDLKRLAEHTKSVIQDAWDNEGSMEEHFAMSTLVRFQLKPRFPFSILLSTPSSSCACLRPVSYTHLDVYKRQTYTR